MLRGAFQTRLIEPDILRSMQHKFYNMALSLVKTKLLPKAEKGCDRCFTDVQKAALNEMLKLIKNKVYSLGKTCRQRFRAMHVNKHANKNSYILNDQERPSCN